MFQTAVVNRFSAPFKLKAGRIEEDSGSTGERTFARHGKLKDGQKYVEIGCQGFYGKDALTIRRWALNKKEA